MTCFLGSIVDVTGIALLFSQPIVLVAGVFQIWMLFHAVQRQDWTWVLLLFFFTLPAAIWYYVTVYRVEGSGGTGFELPGAQSRKRIKELEAKIHHLDKAQSHLELGDIYFQKGKYELAEESYRRALARDKEDPDIQSHLGQCLLRQGKAAEALPFLHGVCSANRQHEYGYTLMALAETFSALNRKEDSAKVWRSVLERYRYDRARVQLAELCLETGGREEASQWLDNVISDADHATAFDKRRNRVWIQKAKALRKKLS